MIQETLAGCREKRQEEREDNGEGIAKPVTTVNNWSLFPVGISVWDTYLRDTPQGSWTFFHQL